MKTDIVDGKTLIDASNDVTIPQGHVLLQDASEQVFFTSIRMYNKWYKQSDKFTLLGIAATSDIRHTLTNQTNKVYENLTKQSTRIISRIGGGCGTCGGK